MRHLRMSGRATQPKDEDRVRAADAFAYTAAFSGRASGSAAPRSRQRDNVTNSLTDDAVSDGFLSDCALSDGEDDRVGTGYGHTHAGPAQRTHAANSKAKLENFIQSQPMLTGAAVHSSADVLTMWAQQDQQHISALQRCVDEWSPRHHACPQAATPQHQSCRCMQAAAHTARATHSQSATTARTCKDAWQSLSASVTSAASSSLCQPQPLGAWSIRTSAQSSGWTAACATCTTSSASLQASHTTCLLRV